MNTETIRRLMVNAGWMHPLDDPIMFVLDREFTPADEQKLWQMVASDATDQKPYIPEVYDCDDFAFSLNNAVNNDPDGMGWATGVLIIETQADPNNFGVRGLHAVFFYCTDKKVSAIEPQDDSPFSRPFKVRGVVMY